MEMGCSRLLRRAESVLGKILPVGCGGVKMTAMAGGGKKNEITESRNLEIDEKCH